MIIVITGTPGTGKTEIAQALAKKLDLHLIEIKKIVEINKSLYKVKNKEKEVDLRKLRHLILNETKKASDLQPKTYSIIIEGHLACELRLPTKFVFVLRCAPQILKRRLEKRKYSKEKVEENLLAEMLDYCTLLARKNFKGKQIIEIDTSKRSLENCVEEITKVIKGKKKKIDDVDYSKELEEYARGKKPYARDII